ncbi:hypothetical protein C8J57DRAFT_264602 [Mycena rebaudengoi]|nr:hypothetical protein C8J57DRAFT_264602 [Mycena rebaudengoi]
MDKIASTCTRCRAMKIRCDGKDPCGPCSRARTKVTCNYTSTSTTVYVSELRKGAACSACRRKKKKCSGNWPCLACVAARTEDDCKFDENSQLSSARALIERARELEKLLYQAKQRNLDILDHQLGPGVLNELDQLGFTSDPVPLTIREDAERAVASSNETGPSSDPILKPDSSQLLPVTVVHKNPNLGDSLDVVSHLTLHRHSSANLACNEHTLPFLAELSPALLPSLTSFGVPRTTAPSIATFCLPWTVLKVNDPQTTRTSCMCSESLRVASQKHPSPKPDSDRQRGTSRLVIRAD